MMDAAAVLGCRVKAGVQPVAWPQLVCCCIGLPHYSLSSVAAQVLAACACYELMQLAHCRGSHHTGDAMALQHRGGSTGSGLPNASQTTCTVLLICVLYPHHTI
jgi:hypothetical protein